METNRHEENEKKISVIIPCYNVEQWIDRCVTSLVNQTIGVDCLELIFVDDASTDGTLSRLKVWEERFPESVVVIVCEENGRQGTARNIGLCYASAPYIGYVDADDWVETDMYEVLYRYAVENNTELTAGLMARDTGDGSFFEIEPYQGPACQKIWIRDEKERHEFFKIKMPGHVGTKLYKKDFLLQHECYFPEQLAYEDNYFGMMMNFELSSVMVVDKPVYHYFVNTQSTVTSRNSSHQLDRLVIEKMILSDVRERGYLEAFHEEMLGHFLQMYYINTLHLIFTRFDTLPVNVLNEMRETVLQSFPDWKDSSYYEGLSEIEKGFLQTLEVEMTTERWQNLKNNYLFFVRKK